MTLHVGDTRPALTGQATTTDPTTNVTTAANLAGATLALLESGTS